MTEENETNPEFNTKVMQHLNLILMEAENGDPSDEIFPRLYAGILAIGLLGYDLESISAEANAASKRLLEFLEKEIADEDNENGEMDK